MGPDAACLGGGPEGFAASGLNAAPRTVNPPRKLEGIGDWFVHRRWDKSESRCHHGAATDGRFRATLREERPESRETCLRRWRIDRQTGIAAAGHSTARRVPQLWCRSGVTSCCAFLVLRVKADENLAARCRVIATLNCSRRSISLAASHFVFSRVRRSHS